jgi:hypothetical protein
MIWIGKVKFIIVFFFPICQKIFVVHNKKRENLLFLLHGDFRMDSYIVDNVTKQVHIKGKVIMNGSNNADR